LPRAVALLSRTRFLAFGDSLTAGTTSPAVVTRMGAGLPQSYPSKLLGLLMAGYPQQTPVVENAGRPSERADAAAERLNEAIRTIQPDTVIILHGANDLVADGIAGVPRTISAVQALVRIARIGGETVLLCTLPPQRVGAQRAANPTAWSELNRGIREIARNEQVALVDLATQLDLSSIGVDGLHPTEEGYLRLAELVYASLRAQLESTQTH
jgi:lysophospholipase L1-like esterase